LLYWLGWRDIKVRYAEAYIGVLWALLQPLAMVSVLSVVLGFLARVPSDGMPYSVFVICGIAVWTVFSNVVHGVANGLNVNASLLSKIYCSRLAVVASAVGAPLVDAVFLFASVVILTLVQVHWISWWVPVTVLFLIWAVFIGVAVGLWFSALSINYKDVSLALPVILQIGMFASPVIYPPSLVPEHFQFFFELNPFVPIIAGVRWSVYGAQAPGLMGLAIAGVTTIFLLVSALYYFNEAQRLFADRM